MADRSTSPPPESGYGPSSLDTLRRIESTLTDDEAAVAGYEWPIWARANQIPPPGEWRVWLNLGGRGSGKTRTGSEFIRSRVEAGTAERIAIAGRTSAEVRDIIVDGESGIMATAPPWFRPVYEPSKRRIAWPNGARATLYTADEPDQARGAQHDLLWADELAAWKYADAWDQLLFGLRLGPDPRAIVTTTPRPTKIIRDLMNDPKVVLTRSRTYDNAANLAPAFIDQIVRRYEGTRLGRQELEGEVLDDVPGALWKRAQIDALRRREHPDLVRVVVAVDPAVTAQEDSDETGIIVAARGADSHAYVLHDASLRDTVDAWARAAVRAYQVREADRIVAEVNNGGDLVERVIRTVDPNAAFTAVRASRGKSVRAEPIAALYEQGKVHHVGTFDALEDQMCAMTPDGYCGNGSPDRCDALVWALTDLMLGDSRTIRAF